MFERYTEKARRVIFFARYEASELGSPTIEAEHLLLALLREDPPLADCLLRGAGAGEALSAFMQQQAAAREKIPTTIDLPLSDEGKRALACAAEEAERFRHKYIGPEHLLLGLLREDKSSAARLLHERGLRLGTARETLREGRPAEVPPAPPPVNPFTRAGGALDTEIAPRHSFERYTEKARRVIFFARYEASLFGAKSIETEHILLGLMRDDRALTERFIGTRASVDAIRQQIEQHTTVREEISSAVDRPLSSACKRVLAGAAAESERSGHQLIGTEHLLLGFLREEKCLAAQILTERGLTAAAVRDALQPPPV